MKAMASVIFTLSLAMVGLGAHANESSCVESYAKVRALYSETLVQAAEASKTSKVFMYGGALGVGLCARMSAGLSTVVGCSVAVAVANLVTYARSLDLQSELEILQSQSRLYDTYVAIRDHDQSSLEPQALAKNTVVDVQKESALYTAFAQAMEQGAFCKDGQAQFDYEKAVEYFKANQP